PAVKRYQALKRKPQTKAQARKNMMIYLKNVADFKMDYFKGMSHDDIRPIFEAKFDSNVAFLQNIKEQIDEEESRALKRINKTLTEKAAKRQKLDEEVEELKRHLQIVPNDDDDVYTEATPLAHKVPVVDYEIYNQNNKPYYKIKRANGTHQLYISFLSMLRNFDKEDLEVLWSLVKERFATVKPKNFFDDFLLITLGTMFEKPERRYPLTRFTLDQMLNNVRLEVEEESEFTRDNNCTIEFDTFGFSVKDFLTRHIDLRCDSSGDLYPVTKLSSLLNALMSLSTSTWHQRLSHPSDDVLRSLSSRNFISCNKEKSPHVCHACQLGKHVKLPFSSSTSIVSSCFEIIHSDIWTFPIVSTGGFKYYVILLEHFSHYLWIYPLRTKSKVFAKFVHFRSYVKN
nr:ribonuclease H-like domain-containing protein [Tanacetum cinerariifolium]